MRFYVGDMAKMLGLTPGALHFFEREGVIQTPKEENGRRYYSKDDIMRLMSYKKYRSMGLSVKEIAKQFSLDGDTMPQIAQKLKKQEDENKKIIQEYQNVQDGLTYFRSAIERIPECLNKIDVVLSPKVLTLCVSDMGFVSHDKKEQALIGAFTNFMPATRIGVISEDQTCKMGYLLEPKEEHPFKADEKIKLVMPRLCLHTISVTDMSLYDQPQKAFQTVFQKMQDNHLQKSGTAFGFVLAVDCSNKKRDIYTEVFVPFCTDF